MNMYRFNAVVMVVVLSAISFSYGQDEEPSAAPKAPGFSLGSSNVGSIANSVNTFTGDVNLPLNLVSIPGQGGLGINLSIFYSSNNIQNIVDTWNLESPTGVLGLGWSFSFPMIVADNKMTGAREDDDFYLVEGGSPTKLVATGISSGVKSFKTKTYANWTISFTSATERWEIIKEDGTKYIYGDQWSNRSTVQWVVKWSNWIGSSKAWTNQRQGMIWNLSEVQNLWGQKVQYTYVNEENPVGSGSAYHTEASYLQKITDAWGREVELVYNNKLAEEYQDPHTELPEPDAYQERYEKKYLDRIDVRDHGISWYQIKFDYTTIMFGTGNLTKRTLMSINKVSNSGEQEPSINFTYQTSGTTKGLLTDVGTSNGGAVSFQYHTGLEITNSSRDLLNSMAPSGYEEPTFIVQGDDYAVVTWRQLLNGSHTDGDRPVEVYAYQFDGRWMMKSLGTIGEVKRATNNFHNQDFLSAARKDFFAILKPVYGTNNYWLYIWRKDEKIPGEWKKESFNISLGSHDATREALVAGDNFVAVTGNNGTIYRYVWNGYTWTSSTVNESAFKHYTVADNNYILSHNTGPNPDVITLYYLDSKKEWQQVSRNAGFNEAVGTSAWYNSNNFGFILAKGGNEFVYTWTETYSAINEYNTGFQYADESNVFITGESQVTLVEPNTYQVKGLRFDGANWHDSGQHEYYYKHSVSAGYDLFTWRNFPDPNSYIQEFDPNTGTWKAAVAFELASGPNWHAHVNSVILQNDVFYRQSNGSWSSLGRISSANTLRPITDGYVHYDYIQYLRNGVFYNTSSNFDIGSWGQAYPQAGTSASKYQYLIGNNTVVKGRTWAPNIDLDGVHLYRSIGYNMKGKISDFPVVKVTVYDGIRSYYTSYSYDPAKAVLDPSGTTTMYNKVTVIDGSQSESNKLYGSTEFYFFNGLSESELGDTFPVEAPYGNAADNYKLLLGQTYRVRALNDANTPVSSTTTIWHVESANIYSVGTFNVVDIAFLARPHKIVNIKDGIETVTEFSYDGASKQMNYQSVVTKHSAGVRETVETEQIYAWQVYPNLQSKNILSPVFQTKKKINGIYVGSEVTRWKEWPCAGPNCPASTVPSPVDQYTWNHTNSSSFSWYDVATQTPGSDWTLEGRSTIRDNASGIVLESMSKGNRYSSSIIDDGMRVVASVVNAGFDKVAYTSFEDATKGNWTWADGSILTASAKTGERHFNLGTSGLTKGSLASGEKYVLSFWAKSESGSVTIDGVGTINLENAPDWKLYQYTVTGLSSLNIRKTGSTDVFIDEIKMYPQRAMITTSTFHPVFGVTSTTNTNEQTSYTTYDGFGRVKNLLDENRNIITVNQYNFKK